MERNYKKDDLIRKGLLFVKHEDLTVTINETEEYKISPTESVYLGIAIRTVPLFDLTQYIQKELANKDSYRFNIIQK